MPEDCSLLPEVLLHPHGAEGRPSLADSAFSRAGNAAQQSAIRLEDAEVTRLARAGRVAIELRVWRADLRIRRAGHAELIVRAGKARRGAALRLVLARLALLA